MLRPISAGVTPVERRRPQIQVRLEPNHAPLEQIGHVPETGDPLPTQTQHAARSTSQSCKVGVVAASALDLTCWLFS